MFPERAPLVVFAWVAATLSCSSGDFAVEQPDTSAGVDSTGSLESSLSDVPLDGAGTGWVACGTMLCLPGNVCCVTPREGGVDTYCAPSCAGGAVPMTCDGPEDCPAAAKYCCGEFAVGPGAFPYCPRAVVGARCNATCPTSIPVVCDKKGQVKRCHKAADCGDDAANPLCCVFRDAGVSAAVCVPDAAKGIAEGCLP